jgi:flagellar biogenesis protein FliO
MSDSTETASSLLQMPLVLAELLFACYGIRSIAHRDFESFAGCILIVAFLGWVVRQISRTATQIKENENL